MEGNSSNEVWKRPENVPYPSIWCKFDGVREINGAIPKFWIQDIQEKDFERFADLMISHFIKDEPISSSTKIGEDNEALKTGREMWLTSYKQKMGIACYMENLNNSEKPILAGFNCTCVMDKKDKPEIEGACDAVFTVATAFDHLLWGIKNPYEELKVDYFLNAVGLYVFPEFRGQGLGIKLLEARTPLCKAVGIPASVTVFTSPYSQKAAEKAGFKVLAEATYVDILKLHPRMRFYDIEKKSKCAKTMYKVF